MNEYISELNVFEYNDNLQTLAQSFSCGNVFIDGFLKSDQALDSGIGKTFVLLTSRLDGIIGFYNITTGSVEQRDDVKSYKIGGSVHINEFAIDKKFQGLVYNPKTGAKISDSLLIDCVNRARFIRHNHVGFSFITLQSTEQGYNFYTRNDFEPIDEDMIIFQTFGKEDECIPMYMPLDLE